MLGPWAVVEIERSGSQFHSSCFVKIAVGSMSKLRKLQKLIGMCIWSAYQICWYSHMVWKQGTRHTTRIADSESAFYFILRPG